MYLNISQYLYLYNIYTHHVNALFRYHHATVLMFCWHAYSARIGTGLWYAAMNYSVHGIMYAYFGMTQVNKQCPTPELVIAS